MPNVLSAFRGSQSSHCAGKMHAEDMGQPVLRQPDQTFNPPPIDPRVKTLLAGLRCVPWICQHPGQ